MGSADNIAVVRRFYEAGPPDDDRERHRFAASNVGWHVPGDNPVSGTYYGHEAVFVDIAARMQPLDAWQIDVVDVMANADRVVATVHLVAARGETRVETDGAHVFRFDVDGRIVEAWGFTADQAGLDDVFLHNA
jgi:ketosteroid isomerase-like protein